MRIADPKQVMQPVAKATPTNMLSHGEVAPSAEVFRRMGILHTSGARARAATLDAAFQLVASFRQLSVGVGQRGLLPSDDPGHVPN